MPFGPHGCMALHCWTKAPPPSQPSHTHTHTRARARARAHTHTHAHTHTLMPTPFISLKTKVLPLRDQYNAVCIYKFQHHESPDGSRRSTRVCCLSACSLACYHPRHWLLCVVICANPIIMFGILRLINPILPTPGTGTPPTWPCMLRHASLVCFLPATCTSLSITDTPSSLQYSMHQPFNPSPLSAHHLHWHFYGNVAMPHSLALCLDHRRA